MINFQDFGRPIRGCEVVHGYIEGSNLDCSRIEDICINFWPLYGCPVMIDEAQWAMNALQKFADNVPIVFQDDLPAPKMMAANMTCWQMTDVQCLLQPFKILGRLKEVRIEIPIIKCVRQWSEYTVAQAGLR